MEKNEFINKNLHKIIEDASPIWRCDRDVNSYTARAILDIMYDEIHGEHEIKVKRSEEAKEFEMIHIKKGGDVGYDLPAILEHPIAIYPNCCITIPTGIFLEIPTGWWASIESRSSTSKNIMIVPKGVIDEGYRGELFAVVINVGKEKQIIHHGDRIAQLIFHKRHNNRFKIVEVDELSESERGDSGFGSTGSSAMR